MVKVEELVSTHSRPKAAGGRPNEFTKNWGWFQHTAARRRLGLPILSHAKMLGFQHTAARRRLGLLIVILGFMAWFQHTAARRRLGLMTMSYHR